MECSLSHWVSWCGAESGKTFRCPSLYRPYACRWQTAVERETACLPAKISRRFMSSKFSLFYFLFIVWISNTIFTAGDNRDSFEWRRLPKISNHSQIWHFHKPLKENKEALYPSSSNHPSYLHPPFNPLPLYLHKQILILTLSPKISQMKCIEQRRLFN